MYQEQQERELMEELFPEQKTHQGNESTRVPVIDSKWENWI